MKLKVGYRTYTVGPMDPVEAEERASVGECHRPNGTIKVKVDQAPEDVADTIIHEVLHAIWQERSLPEGSEERAVTALAHGLTALMADNPGFWPMVAEALQGRPPPALMG